MVANTIPYNSGVRGSAAQSNRSVSSMPAPVSHEIRSLVEGRHGGYTTSGWAFMRSAIYLLPLLLLIGCYLGDPTASRSVVVHLPTPSPQTRVVASQPQEVLEIIDTVMGSHGLARGTNAPAEQFEIANYDVWRETGQRLVWAGPIVYLRSNRLEAAFSEFPARRSSPRIVNLCEELKQTLSSRYGAENVTIQH